MFEQLHQVEELTVDVTTYCNRSIDVLNIAFFDEDLACFEAELCDLGLGERLAFLELLNLQIYIAAHDAVQCLVLYRMAEGAWRSRLAVQMLAEWKCSS